MFDPQAAERDFQRWFTALKRRGLQVGPEDPRYDWRAAFRYLTTTGRPLEGPEFALPDVFGSPGADLPTFTPDFGGFKNLAGPPVPAMIAAMQTAPGPAPVPPALAPAPVAAMPKPTRPGMRLPASPAAATPGASAGGAPGFSGPVNVGQILQDPNFQGLPEQERLKVLRTVDPSFAGLPEAEQFKVIQRTGPDLSRYSTEELQRIASGGSPELAHLSNEDLMQAAGVSVELPGGLGKEEMERVIREQVYGQKPAQGAPTPPEAALTDPMAESIAMFSPVAGVKELAKQVAEHGPAVGAMAAGMARLPAGAAAPITGLGTAAGGLLQRAYTGQEDTIGPREEALMEAGLPFASPEMGRDFLTGVGAEFGGRGVVWAAGKLLAPAAGKLTEGARSFIAWAKKHNLPYSADVAPIWRGKLAQEIADTGLGRWVTTRQRRELVEGASEAAGRVLDDLGLPQPVAVTEAAGDLAGHLRNLANKRVTHRAFNEAMERIPAESEMAVPNLMKALDDIGGLTTISEIYGTREFGLFKRVMHREGRITKAEMDYINKNLWRKWKDMDQEARSLAGKLKEGLLRDLDDVLDPQLGQTLGGLRRAADTAYKEAEAFLQATPLAGELRKAARPEAKARQFFNLFSEGHKHDALAIREHILSTGNRDLWDTVKASYLEGVFSRATRLSEETGERVFQPGAFINWYEKYGRGAMDIMPEHAPALTEWYHVSKGLLKDFKRYGGREAATPTLKLGILTGAGYMAGGVPGVVVANGFALLSALGTMGRGNLGFIRNYLLREAAPFGVPFAKGAAQFGGMEAAQRLNE
jgi:hypothetical protein